MHLGFYEQPCWKIDWITSGRFFAKAITHFMPPGAILYLESYDNDELFRSFVAGHRCPESEKEAIFEPASVPPVWTEHLTFGPPLLDSMEKFYGAWNYNYAHHVHGYLRGKLIFWFHDAFIGGELLISPEVSEENVRAFCADMAPKYEFLKTWPPETDKEV
ncbi:MAG: hypothetical protein ACAH88_16935 [Roseimicrobium sp.]